LGKVLRHLIGIIVWLVLVLYPAILIFFDKKRLSHGDSDFACKIALFGGIAQGRNEEFRRPNLFICCFANLCPSDEITGNTYSKKRLTSGFKPSHGGHQSPYQF
jgi:hypothetical protein